LATSTFAAENFDVAQNARRPTAAMDPCCNPGCKIKASELRTSTNSRPSGNDACPSGSDVLPCCKYGDETTRRLNLQVSLVARIALSQHRRVLSLLRGVQP
jgi:hypothetical protein